MLATKRRYCFATHNQHKVVELRKLFGENIELVSLDDLGIQEDIEETGQTLQENALIKANYIFSNYNIPCFADDTGLEVDALNGAPGVFSARFAGEPADNEKNIDKLLGLLQEAKNRSARFKTVIALVSNDNPIFFEGIVEGEIIKSRKGKGGFGYDSVFLPSNYDRTFAEMSIEEKNMISHRAKAVKKLIEFIN